MAAILKKKILIVDDEQLVCELLTQVLTSHHYTVYVAHDGHEALSVARMRDLDLVIVDIDMPKMNGIEFIQRVKAQHLDVMVLTGKGTQENLKEAIKAGAKDFIVKSPFELRSFLHRIEENLKAQKPEQMAEKEKPSRKAKTEETAVDIRELVALEEIEEKLESIKADKDFSSRLAEILGVAAGHDDAAKNLAEILSRDDALSDKLLRLAADGFWQIQGNVATLEQATAAVGCAGMRDVALSILFVEHFRNAHGDFERIDIVRQSIVCAMIAKTVARKVHHDSEEAAFLTGILHAIGKMYFAIFFPEAFSLIAEKAKQLNMSEDEVESSLFGLTSTKFARRLLTHWGLPAGIRDAVALFRHPFVKVQEFTSKDQTRIALMALSSSVAEALSARSSHLQLVRRMDNQYFEFVGIQSRDDLQAVTEDVWNQLESIQTVFLGAALPQDGPNTLQARGDDAKTICITGCDDNIYDFLTLHYGRQFRLIHKTMEEIAPDDFDVLFLHIHGREQAQAAPTDLAKVCLEKKISKPIFLFVPGELQRFLQGYHNPLHPVLYHPVYVDAIDTLLKQFYLLNDAGASL